MVFAHSCQASVDTVVFSQLKPGLLWTYAWKECFHPAVEFLIYWYSAKTSVNSGEMMVWLEIMLLIKPVKHMAYENQPMAAVVLSTHHAPCSPATLDRGATASRAWRRQRKKAIRVTAFPVWKSICQEWGRASGTWTNAAANHAQPKQRAAVGFTGTSHSSGR